LRDRFDQLEEQLQILHGMWTTPEGGSFSFKGHWYELANSPALPRPVQRPHPPIIVGGYGPERTPRLAARYADEFNAPPPGAVARAGAAFEVVDRACAADGRDPATLRRSVTVTTLCAATPTELTRRRAAKPGPIGEPDVAGTAEQVAEQLAPLRDMGVAVVYLRVADLHDLEHVAYLGEELVPLLR
jgi:alkanesulfonate monooxygenase SsuD/methylene tetrahydromethanopterin reductase-like flavin-dependent oxidoreductase (luciferase family)